MSGLPPNPHRRTLKACAKCGGIGVPGESYCARHAEEERTRRAEKRKTAGYSSSHWQRTRAERLALADHKCELQLVGCTETATHGILLAEAGRRHDTARLEDTRAACSSCAGAYGASHGGPHG